VEIKNQSIKQDQKEAYTMWQAWTNGILGVWLAVAAFLQMDVPSAKMNDIFIGAIVALVAYYMPKEKAWQRWLMIVVGAWVFVAGFIPGLVDGNGYASNNLISGVLIAIAGFAAFTRTPGVKTA
jgi:hypothetical protein